MTVTRSDLRDLRRIQRLEPTRALGDYLRSQDDRRRQRPLETTPQLLLALVPVVCIPMHASITLAQCIARQSARTESGRGKGFLVNEECGTCELRDVHRALAGSMTVPRYRADPVKLGRQRAAMASAYQSGALDRVPTIDDPMSEEG